MEKPPSILTSIAAATLLAIAGGALMVTKITYDYAKSTEEAAQERIVVDAATAISHTASTLFERETGSLFEVSGRIQFDDYQMNRHLLDGVTGASEAVVWGGILDPTGLVVAGAYGRGEGEELASEVWFNAGLDGRAQATTLPDGWSWVEESDGGLIHISSPIKGASGEVMGVVAFSLKIAWLDDFLSEAANALGLGYEVRQRNGVKVMQVRTTPEAEARLEELAVIGSLGQRFMTELDLTGPGSHVAAYLPVFIDAELPGLDWGLTIWAPSTSSPQTFSSTFLSLRYELIGLAAIISICAGFFAIAFLYPVCRLATHARRISTGKDSYPPATQSSQEAQDISNAFAVLQSKVMNHMTDHATKEGKTDQPQRPRLVG